MACIREVQISRYDQNGHPCSTGDIDIVFHDDNGLIVASATVKPSGWVCAHSIEGGKITARAVMQPGETESS